MNWLPCDDGTGPPMLPEAWGTDNTPPVVVVDMGVVPLGGVTGACAGAGELPDCWALEDGILHKLGKP